MCTYAHQNILNFIKLIEDLFLPIKWIIHRSVKSGLARGDVEYRALDSLVCIQRKPLLRKAGTRQSPFLLTLLCWLKLVGSHHSVLLLGVCAPVCFSTLSAVPQIQFSLQGLSSSFSLTLLMVKCSVLSAALMLGDAIFPSKYFLPL